MKVVTASEMARLEKQAYARGASEESFMNAAGQGVAECALQCIAERHLPPAIALLAGKGNNGGDAFAAARFLLSGEFLITVFACFPIEACSSLSQLQRKRFEAQGGKVVDLRSIDDLNLAPYSLLIDGLLGTGFKGPVSGLLAQVIEKASASNIYTLAIDIPSGIDGNTGALVGPVMRCDKTLFLGLPKRGAFMGKSWNFVGQIATFDFGLGQGAEEQAQADFFLIEEHQAASLLPPIVRTRHKYESGYVIGIGGSPGMPGAPLLASKAALRTGAGIVRLLHPRGMESELANGPLELIREGYPEGDSAWILAKLAKAKALFIGPGIGISQATQTLLKELLPQLEIPCVIDAEALTLIAQNDLPLPKQCLLTPHQGEMRRLLKETEGDVFALTQKFANRTGATVVLKGAPTFVFQPQALPHVCTRGDPGMATAGSGDVLTGVLAAFLAQGKSLLEAAILGVYVHGMAGESAAKKSSSYCMLSGEIIDHLPDAFKALIPLHKQA